MTEKTTPGRQTVKLHIRLGFPTITGERDDPGPRTRAHLEVRDDASGVILVDVEFGPAELMDLMRGSGIEVAGEASLHLERVGKTMEIGVVPLAEVTSEEQAEAVARAYVDSDEWDTVQVSKRRAHKAPDGFAWAATLRRWR